MIDPHGMSRMILTAWFGLGVVAHAVPARSTRVLDGPWQIGEGGMDASPPSFDHQVPVPGLVDMARPAFEDVGVKSTKREAFWYRRTFELAEPPPAVAWLKVNKAMFGTRVLLNGILLGEHRPSFTPGYFDAKPALKTGVNELLIGVGAFRDAVPKPQPDGWDYENSNSSPASMTRSS